MLAIRRTGLIALALLSVQSQGAFAQTSASAKPYQVEWVYRVKYGFQDEWWRLFQKYQIAALDEEQRRGYVKSYIVVRPGLHTSEDARWDYRIVITYNAMRDHYTKARSRRLCSPMLLLAIGTRIGAGS